MVGAVEQRVKHYLDKIKKEDGKINAFLHLNEHALAEAKAIDAKKHRGRLAGKVIAVKSNINVQGLICNCASKTLENYTAPYDAAVIEKIRAEDGVIIGMTNMDEFAAGWSGETSAFGATHNPVVAGCVPGGSSSGSAAAVAAGFCDVALGSETGGSIRVPASFCGIVGVKPSYGCVSRYGLVDLSMSLDQIGTMARTVAEAALVLDVIKGHDARDCMSVASHSITLTAPKKLRAGVVRVAGVHSEVQKHIDYAIASTCTALGWTTKSVEVPYLEAGIETYFPIVWTEFFSATRRFDGRRYGKKIEEVAGAEVLRRIYGGEEIARSEAGGRYYYRALQVRELIRASFEKMFKDVDCLLLPTVSVLPWKLGAKLTFEELYAADMLTCPVNLAGICALSVPTGAIQGKPVGLQVICDRNNESLLLSIGSALEGVL
jgi:aspartyl-tRNA(Asn)/glutamyl-tRNA(Gln) amidotransferase subunit A